MMRTMDSVTLEPFEGLHAIQDTMHDIMLNVVSALTISIMGFFDSKYSFGLFEKWIIHSTRNSVKQESY